MSSFEVEFEVTGLKLRIKGSREDVPLMTQAVGQQIAGMLAPAVRIVEGEIYDVPSKAVEPPVLEQKNGKKRHTRSRSTAATSPKASEKTDDKPLDWRHDPAKWGSPQQGWVTTDKAIWLLYVVSQELNISDMSARLIANTFTKHFRQSGRVLMCNVNRDLGKLKGKRPSMISEDTTKDPPAWFLTEAGIAQAQNLITQALGSHKVPKLKVANGTGRTKLHSQPTLSSIK